VKFRLFISSVFILLAISAFAQHPVIGGYNVYYGDLHNHSNVSDGTGTPAEAYNYARNTAHLDFFGLSDHSNNSGSISSVEWADIKNQADLYNEDGIFSTFYGFEWSSDGTYGHVSVFNTGDYCTTASPTETFDGLVVWLASRPDGVAFLNHPGNENTSGLEFNHFSTTPPDQFVGIDLFNRGDGFNIYYYNNGYYSGDNNKGYFDEANSRGWKIGASGSGDNHFATWGTTFPYRLAILSNNLTRTDLLAAMRARRFFSTLDKNLSLSFKINGMEMGSVIVENNYTLQVQAADADGEIFNQVVIYNKDHVVVNTWTLNTNAVNVSMNLSTADGDYYYVKVRQADGDEAISSPIWISGTTRNKYPVCSISSPSNGATFITPADITINANALDPDGSVTKVEFYEGTTKLGEDFSSPFSFTWSGVTTGSYSLIVRATDDSSAVSTSSAVSVHVGRIPITVTADNKSKTYGGSDPALTYRITSGSLSGSDTFTGSLARDIGEDADNYTIRRGTLDLDSKYNLTFVTANLTITARPITVTAGDKSKIYGNPDPPLTYTITSGTLVGSDVFSGSLTRETGENVGVYEILQGTLRLGTNYNLTFRNAELDITARPITVTADDVSRVYGNPDLLTYRITSGSLAGTDDFTGSLARTAGEDVGTYPITRGTLSSGSNYSLTYIGADLVITLRPVTVTADNVSKIYGDPDHLTYHITSGSLAGTDTFTGALTRNAGENTGNYFITQGSLSLGSNYLFTFSGANLVITARAVTVTSDEVSKLYGTADHLTYRITSGTLVGSDAFSGNLTRDPGENAGTYAIRQGTLALNNNYAFTFRGSNLTITARMVSVSADPRTKVYGESDPALTYHITSGTLAGTDTFSGTLSRTAGENIGTYSIGMGNLALNNNYVLAFTGANLNITSLSITVTADSRTKIFGEQDPELTYRITSGFLAGNGDFFTGKLIRKAGEDVGTYAISKGTLSINSNYTLTYIPADLSIERSVIIIAADAKSKIYGEAEPGLTYHITSGTLVEGDAISGELSREPGEDVGFYTVNQGTLGLSSNYTLDFINADLAIMQRPVTVNANSRKKVHGESDPELTYRITSGSLVENDSFTGSLTRTPGEDVGIYPILSGDLFINNNYNITFLGAEFKITAGIEIITYPNPFTDHICFELEVNNNSRIIIEIFSMSGKKIATVFSGEIEPNFYRFDYVPENVSSGFLIYQVTIDGHVVRGKIIHI
jgi:hypothetical protein